MKLSWLNAFQLCKFLKALGHVMVLAVLALVGVSYYCVVVVTLGGGMSSGKPHIVLLDLVLAILFNIVVSVLKVEFYNHRRLLKASPSPARWPRHCCCSFKPQFALLIEVLFLKRNGSSTQTRR